MARKLAAGKTAERRRERRRAKYAKAKLDPHTPQLPSKERCADLARILMAGVPSIQAVAFVDPGIATLSAKKQKAHALHWLRSPYLAAEVALLNGGDWDRLEKDVRIRLAFDKHLAELAYLLYSKSYITADPATEAKMDSARGAIGKYLDASTVDPEAPWAKAIREIYEGRLDGRPLGDVAKTVEPGPTKES